MISLLLLSAVVMVITQRLRIPYTVGLVLVGLGLAFFGRIPLEPIAPELILALLVPALVFEAAYHLDITELRRNLPVLLMLVIPGVILTTLLVGGLVSFGTGMALSTALVFGALISATDPVAVVALFRTLGVPRRLQVLLEGESLLNDGTAIVIFNLMLAFALTGSFNLISGIGEFVVVAGGGILVGVLFGMLVSYLIGKIDNYLVETTLTTVLAYGSYLIAEEVLGVSGVLAVVAAGLATGNIGPKGMSPTTRIVIFNFWEYAAFLANSFVFLLIGLQIDLGLLVNYLPAIAMAVVAVLLARLVIIYGLSWVGKTIPMSWKRVMFWGGLRGAISLALALSLSANLENRVQLQVMAFGVVLFSILAEGLTMKPLIHRLGLLPERGGEVEFERTHARLVALRAAQNRLRRLRDQGLFSEYSWQALAPFLKHRSDQLTEDVRRVLQSDPGLHQEELKDAWRELLRTERSTLTDLFRDNTISEDVYNELVGEIDAALDDPQSTWPELLPAEEEDLPGDIAET
ncbi:MAG TPA: Na+/H+ antiporter [Anaerolineaceae bacterium]|nr:Na+/H+ antiporter [Anaerolineaceae bacterium]